MDVLMPCEQLGKWMVCFHTVYNYKNFVFEDSFMGPWPLRKKDLMPYLRLPGEKHTFWKVYEKFNSLSDKEKEKYEVQ